MIFTFGGINKTFRYISENIVYGAHWLEKTNTVINIIKIKLIKGGFYSHDIEATKITSDWLV